MVNTIKCPICNKTYSFDEWNKKTAAEFNQLPTDHIDEIEEKDFTDDGEYKFLDSMSPSYVCPGCGSEVNESDLTVIWDEETKAARAKAAEIEA